MTVIDLVKLVRILSCGESRKGGGDDCGGPGLSMAMLPNKFTTGLVWAIGPFSILRLLSGRAR